MCKASRLPILTNYLTNSTTVQVVYEPVKKVIAFINTMPSIMLVLDIALFAVGLYIIRQFLNKNQPPLPPGPKGLPVIAMLSTCLHHTNGSLCLNGANDGVRIDELDSIRPL